MRHPQEDLYEDDRAPAFVRHLREQLDGIRRIERIEAESSQWKREADELRKKIRGAGKVPVA